MELIDSHAHIYLPEFDGDREAIIEKAKNEGILRIIMPAIDLSTHTEMLAVEQQFSECIAMMGLHPCSVKDNYKEELTVVENYLQQRNFAAIGEIGLDFYWDKTFTNEQYHCFHRQIEMALEHNFPIVIHSRNAVDECIAVVEQYPGLRGIFHCFSGSLEQAKRIIKAGFFLGIGGVVTFKNSGLDKVIQEITFDKILLETDAPFLAPVPHRGKRNESSYLKLIVEKISEIKQLSVAEVAEITTANARKIFPLQ